MTPTSDVATFVVRSVAELEHVQPEDLPPLCTELDGETLERLTDTDRPLTEPLSFQYLWYDVTVFPDEEVVVTP